MAGLALDQRDVDRGIEALEIARRRGAAEARADHHDGAGRRARQPGGNERRGNRSGDEGATCCGHVVPHFNAAR